MLTVEQKWRVERHRYMTPGGWQDLFVPKPNWWTGDEGFRYGPDKLVGRMAGEQPIWCWNQSYYSKTLTRLTFKAPDGTEYELRDQLTGGQRSANACNSMSVPTRGAVFTTADGSSVTFVADGPIPDQLPVFNGPIYTYPSGYLLFKDGTRYRIDAGKVTWLRDRNGNKVSFTYDVSNRVSTVTDSLNRQVTVAYEQAEFGESAPRSPITLVMKIYGFAQKLIEVARFRAGCASVLKGLCRYINFCAKP